MDRQLSKCRVTWLSDSGHVVRLVILQHDDHQLCESVGKRQCIYMYVRPQSKHYFSNSVQAFQ